MDTDWRTLTYFFIVAEQLYTHPCVSDVYLSPVLFVP
jgi:hypothetical protein